MKKSLVTNYKSKRIVKSYLKYPQIHYKFGIPSLLKFINNIENLTILDIGCGSGILSQELHLRKANVIGIDSSLGMIEEAKQKYPLINFMKLNAIDIRNIRSQSIDKIIMFNLLVNIKNTITLKKIFTECGRVLKNNGEVIISLLHPLLLQKFNDEYRSVNPTSKFSYFNEEIYIKSKYLLRNNHYISFLDKHWKISSIIKLMLNNYSLVDICEPDIYSDGGSKREGKLFRIPEYLFLKFKFK